MKRTNLIGRLMAVFALFLLSSVVYAGKPVWAFTPLSATSITVPANGTATIQYQVRNQSPTNPHRLVMMPLSGVSQDGPCTVSPKGQPGDSCTLTLTVTGNKVPKGGISGGPKLCQANKDGTPNPNQCYQPSKENSLSITVVSSQYTVTATGDSNVTVTPASQSVAYGATTTLTVTPATGYTATVSGCGGSLTGTTYTTGPITSACTVTAVSVAIFPVAEGPSNVIAVPGNGQVTVSWTAPTNTGTGTISSYTVTYGPTSGTTFTTPGCTTSSTSCTVKDLTNDTIAYTFAVTTTTTLSGVNETGPATFSSSVTPTTGLAVSPSTLALSSIAGSNSARIITLTNNSTSSSITLSAVPTTYSDFSPSLPSDITISSTCSTTTSLAANGGFCTITITPGTTASNNSLSQACTNGTAPTTSVFNVTTSPAVAINAVVLGYGCQYQGGYLFSIDDTAPTTSSIGGTVVATLDQGSSVQWSPSGVFDSIWGIDDTSTPTSPSPNASSSEPATLKLGQLNCNAVNDGACATTNTFVYYGTGTNYAVGLCKQALNNSGTTCSGGSSCYTDWHLPSTCELGPFGSTGTNTGNYPSLLGSQSCSSGSTNIQNELVSTSIVNLSGFYWSATDYSVSPQSYAWLQGFASSGSGQYVYSKFGVIGVRCVRGLTH